MEQYKFEDAESTFGFAYGKDKITFKDIVLNHLRKITLLASVEFRGGYWEERIIPVVHASGGGSITNRVYIPDSRECYSNAIENLADLLYPYFDKEMKKAEEEVKSELRKAYLDNTIIKEETETSKSADKQRVFERVENRVLYRDVRVKINRRLFRALCSFLYRKKYLELGTIED